MAIRAQSQDRGEQSLLELRRPQPAGAPSRGVAGNNQPSMDAETEIVRARAPPIGGLFVATALTLLVVPALYRAAVPSAQRRDRRYACSPSATDGVL